MVHARISSIFIYEVHTNTMHLQRRCNSLLITYANRNYSIKEEWDKEFGWERKSENKDKNKNKNQLKANKANLKLVMKQWQSSVNSNGMPYTLIQWLFWMLTLKMFTIFFVFLISLCIRNYFIEITRSPRENYSNNNDDNRNQKNFIERCKNKIKRKQQQPQHIVTHFIPQSVFYLYFIAVAFFSLQIN